MSLNKNHKTKLWDKNRKTIHSRKGGWKIGDAIYSHGYSLMDDLVGEVSYFQVLVLNITGKLPSQQGNFKHNAYLKLAVKSEHELIKLSTVSVKFPLANL